MSLTHGGVSGLWQQFGNDKTLVAAVLANAALAGMVAWRQVPTLPFEALCLPKRWQRRLPPPASPATLPRLSPSAVPSFIMIRPRNPITRLLRHGVRNTSMSLLERLQAADGSFVDSIPITSFVVMSLASIGCQDHPVVQRGVEFLLSSLQADASWRTENNLAVWNTTLAVNHLVDARPVSAPSSLGRLGSQLLPEKSAFSPAAWDDTARVGEGLADTAVADEARSTGSESRTAPIGEEEHGTR